MMDWTCQQVEERLTDYLDDAVSVADRRAITAHTQRCAACRGVIAQVGGMVANLHQIEPLEPPSRLIHRILSETGPEQKSRGWLGLAWLNPRLAMGVLSVALTLVMVVPALDIEWGKLAWSDLRPTNLYRSVDRRATLLYARGVKFVNGLRVLHEIQSRLQPSSDPQAVPVKEEMKDETEQEPKKDEKGREQNRAFEPQPAINMLAQVTIGLRGWTR
jgi:hypothetical protein